MRLQAHEAEHIAEADEEAIQVTSIGEAEEVEVHESYLVISMEN